MATNYCSCCKKMIEVVLKGASIALIGIVAAAKQDEMSTAARTTLVSMAVIFYTSPMWLAHFISKNCHILFVGEGVNRGANGGENGAAS
jgi:hypothetical protein